MIKRRPTISHLTPYVPGKPIEEVKRELGIQKVIKMASNENPLGCSPAAKKAVAGMLDHLEIYPDGNCTELRAKISDLFGLPPEHFLFGAGSDEILGLIAQTYINPEDEAIMAYPSFPRYETVTRVMDGKPVQVPLKNHTLDLEGMARAITPKTKVIWLCNPNNPTGTIYTAAQQRELLEKTPPNVLVVLDEAYYEYVIDDDYPESVALLEEYPNIIILRTFSKIYGLAALRVGYAIGHPDMISDINRVRGPFNVNTASQVAALASLDDPDFVERSRQNNEQGKEYLYKAFESMGLEYIKTHGNFVMVDTGRHSKDVFHDLLRMGIIVRTADIFDMDTWLRVTISTPEENREFIEALQKVLR
ncbi:MAG TPA: histidinol-phosphate transaminase [Clostridiales bacterium]|nr:histidinol-phosphate transaminase [Clostridiales bacterium]